MWVGSRRRIRDSLKRWSIRCLCGTLIGMAMAKGHILQEIKRTAAKNGGAPLGTALFEAETGIRTADWCGIHWARWGDALREAGFEPNQMRGAYKAEHVLQKFAELAQELGRIPVKAECAMKRKRDPNFPSFNVFARFGSKADLIRELSQFCRSSEGFDAVLAMCEEQLQQPPMETVRRPGLIVVFADDKLLTSWPR